MSTLDKNANKTYDQRSLSVKKLYENPENHQKTITNLKNQF